MLFLSPLATAGEEANAPASVQQQVRVMAVQAQEQTERVDAFSNFLADLVAVKEGRAPKGWTQPTLAAYQAPGAPASFLPVAAPIAVAAAPAVPTVHE